MGTYWNDFGFVNAIEFSCYDILCSSSRGSLRWPVFVVSGDLQPLGTLSKAEFMERMCVISLSSLFPDRIFLTD